MLIHWFNRDEIVAFEHVAVDVLHRVGNLCGSRIVYRLDDLKSEYLGEADLIETFESLHNSSIIMKEKSSIVSLFLTASTTELSDELKRACEDTLKNIGVLMKGNSKFVPGGGAVEVELQNQLRNVASKVESLEQVGNN